MIFKKLQLNFYQLINLNVKYFILSKLKVRDDLENDLNEKKDFNIADYYIHQRLPGWTDRILYKTKIKSNINIIKYDSLNEVYISDHK